MDDLSQEYIIRNSGLTHQLAYYKPSEPNQMLGYHNGYQTEIKEELIAEIPTDYDVRPFHFKYHCINKQFIKLHKKIITNNILINYKKDIHLENDVYMKYFYAIDNYTKYINFRNDYYPNH